MTRVETPVARSPHNEISGTMVTMAQESDQAKRELPALPFFLFLSFFAVLRSCLSVASDSLAVALEGT